MTTQVVTGKICTNGPKGYIEIPLETTITDNDTSQEVFTDATYTVAAQSLGIYGENQKILGGWISAKSGIKFAVIVNNGIVRAMVPITSRTAGASGSSDMVVLNPITLNPGDQLLVQCYA
jgi:hypothetical protein